MSILKMKTALIIGICGQDGSYLAEFLLNKDYVVYGLMRYTSSVNDLRIRHITSKNFHLHYGDITQHLEIILKQTPDEIYNLAGQSDTSISWNIPEYTLLANGLGVLKILQLILNLNIKLFQASTYEIFDNSISPQNEQSLIQPDSPYAISKFYAHSMVKLYRTRFNIFCCNGILFPHESPRSNYIVKKTIKIIVEISKGTRNFLSVNDLNLKIDLGHAKDYIEAMWKMLQISKPCDFVIGTGKCVSLLNIITTTFNKLGIYIEWKDLVGFNKKNGKILVKAKYKSDTVNEYRANVQKANIKLNWQPTISSDKLIDEIISSELHL